jgi:hypothetical protein
VLKSDNLYPTPGLSRIGWISVLIDPQHLLTPFLDRAASQEQKQFEFTFAAIAQNLRRLAKLMARPPPPVAACVA